MPHDLLFPLTKFIIFLLEISLNNLLYRDSSFLKFVKLTFQVGLLLQLGLKVVELLLQMFLLFLKINLMQLPSFFKVLFMEYLGLLSFLI